MLSFRDRALMEGVLDGSLTVVGQPSEQSKRERICYRGWIEDKPKAWTGQAQERGLMEECGKAGVKTSFSKAQELREKSGWEMLSLEEALTSMERMPQPPSVQNLTCILHKCRIKKNPAYTKRLYAYLSKNRLEDHRSIGNYVVPMLVQVGSTWDAQQVFNKLADRNEYSWSSLIWGYIESGDPKHALKLYQQMQEKFVQPSRYTFIAVLKACARLKDAKRGQQIHAEISRKGLETDLAVINTLVDMYAKCASFAEAREAVDKLPVRDEVSWNALIAGYAQHGLGEEALNCLEQMQWEDLFPNAVTFVCSLKACGNIGRIDSGREIHAEMARKGLERDLVIGNTLVDMYAKCGSLGAAREAFDKLSVRDEVSWNALITGYVQHGLGGKALDCLEQMQLDCLYPNAVTFVCSLKACGSKGAIEKGREIHAKIVRKGLETDLIIGNSLVDMYAKCGSLAEAQEAFDQLPVRDEVSWTALIAMYAEQGLGEGALDCLQQMQLEGLSLNAVTFGCSLKACGSIGAIDKVQEIHAEIARKGLESDLVIGNTLVDLYASGGSLVEAREAFNKLPVRDEVSWTALMAGYAEQGLGEDALNFLEQMQLEGFSPNAVTFICSLKACGCIGAIDQGREIHAEIANGELETDLVVSNTLVDMYAKCGSLAEAREAFDKLSVRDEVSWNALMAGYAEHGLGKEALNCLEEMQLEGLSPNVVTFICSLKACGSIGATDKGREMHAKIAMEGLGTDLAVGNTLVDMYAKCGSLAEAWEAFDKLPVRDEVSWNALIGGYAQHGESEIVFHMLERMTGEHIKPNGVTFSIVLTICSHMGLVDEGQNYFEAMSRNYGITPTVEHHSCMVDIFGRAGKLDEAVALVKKVPFHPNLVLWLMVLGACRKWGNVELGRLAFEHAMQLDEKDASPYVLMSNIYADAHMQEEEKKVKVMRVKKQANKNPGQSWWLTIGELSI